MIRIVFRRNYLFYSAKQQTGQVPSEARTNNKSSSQSPGKLITPSPRWNCFPCTNSIFFVKLEGNFTGEVKEELGNKLGNYQRSQYFSLPCQGTCPNCAHPPRRGGGHVACCPHKGRLLVPMIENSSPPPAGKAVLELPAASTSSHLGGWGPWMEPVGTFSVGSCFVWHLLYVAFPRLQKALDMVRESYLT